MQTSHFLPQHAGHENRHWPRASYGALDRGHAGFGIDGTDRVHADTDLERGPARHREYQMAARSSSRKISPHHKEIGRSYENVEFRIVSAVAIERLESAARAGIDGQHSEIIA